MWLEHATEVFTPVENELFSWYVTNYTTWEHVGAELTPAPARFPTLFRIRPRASHPYQCTMCSCKAACLSPPPPPPPSNGLEINKPYRGLNRGFTVSSLSSHEYPVAQWFFRAICVTDWKIIFLMYSPGSKFIILSLSESSLFVQSSAMLACKFWAKRPPCRRHLKNRTVKRKYTQEEWYLNNAVLWNTYINKAGKVQYLIFNMALCTYTGFPSIINVKSLVSWEKNVKDKK